MIPDPLDYAYSIKKPDESADSDTKAHAYLPCFILIFSTAANFIEQIFGADYS
jgi:hypothetical protein